MTVEYKSRSYGICWLFLFIRSEYFRWSFHTDLCFQTRHDFNIQVPIFDNTDQTDCRLWKFLCRKGQTIIWKLFRTWNPKQYSFAFMEIELSSFRPFMFKEPFTGFPDITVLEFFLFLSEGLISCSFDFYRILCFPENDNWKLMGHEMDLLLYWKDSAISLNA